MILLTGAAGFIGFHTARALLEKGLPVVGVDNLNDYYEVSLKEARLAELSPYPDFVFHKADISDREAMESILRKHPEIHTIVHLAAQAGVRYSLENPHVYGQSNLTGQIVMLELARNMGRTLKHFVYASSSSVYGGNTKQPFSVEDPVCQPISLYAATKRAGELLVQSYSHLFRIPATGLRFFTVYGPWGRPDMACFSFARDILNDTPISVYNNGNMKRDFTYIDDIVSGVLASIETVPQADSPGTIGGAPHRIFNLGNNRSERLLDFIETLETALGKKAQKIMKPLAPGDVVETYADIDFSREILGYDPKTPISQGVPRFVEWYRAYLEQHA